MGENRMYDTDLTDEQYEAIKGVIERRSRVGRPTRVELRAVLNAMFYLVRTGCQWRMLPKEYPKWQTVRYYFDKWHQDGLWHEINRLLVAQVREKRGARPRPR